MSARPRRRARPVRGARGAALGLVVAGLLGCASEEPAPPARAVAEERAPAPAPTTPPGARVVAEGQGWTVTAQGQPVDTFESAADAPAGFAPRGVARPQAAAAARKPAPAPAPAAPWVEAPTAQKDAAAQPADGERLRLKAEGVTLTRGRCGAVPVARYGIDWRPAREWRPGDEAEPVDPWRLKQDPRLPPVPEPAGPPPPPVEEHGAPAGSWIHVR